MNCEKMDLEKLHKQLNFLIEIDKAKQVFRNTVLMDASRKENDAEHSWHMAVAAFVLREYADFEEPDMEKVFKMILLHDLTEIDAGDVFAYAVVDKKKRAEDEKKAAERIFGLLPEEQKDEFKALWIEFDERKTNESKFANALDRFMPILHNYRTKGLQWKRLNVTKEQVLTRNRNIEEGSKALWEYIQFIVQDAVEKGYLKDGMFEKEPDIRFIKAGSEEYRQALILRDNILRKPLGLNLFEEDLSREVDDLHIGVFIKENLIAVLTLTPLNKDAVKMRQVAVKECYQGQGIGTKTVAFAEKEAKKRGYQQIVLHARKTAVPFYEKMGYSIVSGEFTEIHIPHYKMEKRI